MHLLSNANKSPTKHQVQQSEEEQIPGMSMHGAFAMTSWRDPGSERWASVNHPSTC